MGVSSWIRKAAGWWEAVQVELHGFYSVQRVEELVEYSRRVSTLRALVVLALVPWPCVIITILVDMIHLRPPSEGLHANQLFIVRTFLAFFVASGVVYLQFRHSVPPAPLSIPRIVFNCIAVAGLTTCVLYGMSAAVGFPLPFGIITVSPAWVAFLLIPLTMFLKQARSDPNLWPLVLNSLKVWVCQEGLVVVYPSYFYFFTTLPAKAKTPFALLLPLIKIGLRNVVARSVVHLKDEIPQVVITNVDVFSSLFMSYCMQNTPSLWTTLGLMAADAAQMVATMHDIDLVVRRLRVLQERIDARNSRRIGADRTSPQTKVIRRKTLLVLAEDMLERHASARSARPSTTVDHGVEAAMPTPSAIVPLRVKSCHDGVPNQLVFLPGIQVRPQPDSNPNLRKVFTGPIQSNIASSKGDSSQLEFEYLLKVRKVLYIIEFVVMINYVEVIVPLIFSANLVAMYHLPNRVYYSQIANMDDHQLRETLKNVLLYCGLQILSLVTLWMLLWRKLHMSALRQLAYVLEKQAVQVQTNIVFWVFYNVQATLQHFASDYTFKFAWLYNTPET